MDSQIKFAISSPVIVMIIMKVFVGIVALLALSSLITSLPISNQEDSKELTNSLSVLSQKTGAALTPVLGSQTLFQQTGLRMLRGGRGKRGGKGRRRRGGKGKGKGRQQSGPQPAPQEPVERKI